MQGTRLKCKYVLMLTISQSWARKLFATKKNGISRNNTKWDLVMLLVRLKILIRIFHSQTSIWMRAYRIFKRANWVSAISIKWELPKIRAKMLRKGFWESLQSLSHRSRGPILQRFKIQNHLMVKYIALRRALTFNLEAALQSQPRPNLSSIWILNIWSRRSGQKMWEML